MAKPVMTQELVGERTVPDCPHCGADMDRAAVTLSDLVDAVTGDKFGTWRVRVDQFVAVDAGGYADTEKSNVVALCTACKRPSVLAIDGHAVKLIAARTEIDRRFLEAQGE